MIHAFQVSGILNFFSKSLTAEQNKLGKFFRRKDTSHKAYALALEAQSIKDTQQNVKC